MRHTILLTSLLLSCQAFAQDANQISQWQEEHPNMIVMSYQNFNALDSAEQIQLQDKVIFLEELDPSSANFSLEEVSAQMEEQFELENFVKRWLAENNTVKIVKQSEYQAANEAQKALYDQTHIMVLEGEEITRRDIENF